MFSRIALTAAALAALALPAAAAADGDRGGKSANAAAESETRPKQDRRAEERGGSDLASCKRDADGMRGPERSRFMTQCLKERK